MTAISHCNDERVFVAHARLEPQNDGSVVLNRLQVTGGELKGKGEKWGPDDLAKTAKPFEGPQRTRAKNETLKPPGPPDTRMRQ
jgi:hypothetical protein